MYLGSPGNHVDGFGGELFEHLRQKVAQKAFLARVDGIPALTMEASNYPAALCAMLSAALGVGPDGIRQGLIRLAARAPRRRVPVFWLDWGTYPRPGMRSFSEGEVLRWQEALHDALLAHLPKDMAAVSLIGLEVNDVHGAYGSLRSELAEGDLLTGPLQIEVLEPLGEIDQKDLIDLFRENAEVLRIHQVDWAAVGRCILGKTNGGYAATVQLLKEARDMGWRTFLRERCRGRPQAGSRSDDG